jgi:hypothetical protein
MSKKKKKVAVSNTWAAPISSLAGLGLAALNLYANGVTPATIGISVASTVLGGLAKDPEILTRKPK